MTRAVVAYDVVKNRTLFSNDVMVVAFWDVGHETRSIPVELV